MKKQVTPGTLIKRRLKAMGWSVELLAEELGVTVKHCKRMLAGSVGVIGKTGDKICKLLRIPPVELVLASAAHPPKSRKAEGTPRGKVRAAFRQLFLRSRERLAALKAAKYGCERCGAKQSRAEGKEVSIEIHHLKPVNWEPLIDAVYETLLCDPSSMVALCKSCHDFEHGKKSD